MDNGGKKPAKEMSPEEVEILKAKLLFEVELLLADPNVPKALKDSFLQDPLFESLEFGKF